MYSKLAQSGFVMLVCLMRAHLTGAALCCVYHSLIWLKYINKINLYFLFREILYIEIWSLEI